MPHLFLEVLPLNIVAADFQHGNVEDHDQAAAAGEEVTTAGIMLVFA